MESFIKFINDYNDLIDKHKKSIDTNAVEDAYIVISKYKERIGELQKRLDNLRVASQNSASEAESIKNMGEQLVSDIDEQRAAMFKQRVAVTEKNYAAIEKKIAETQQKIAGAETTNDEVLQKLNEAKEEIVEAKQNIDKAKANNNENSLKSAEYDLISAEADRRSADAQQRSAEADRRSADAQQRSAEAVKEIMKQDSTRVKERMTEFYDLYIQNPNNIKQDDLNFMKKSTKEFIADCKKRGIDYRAILLKEV